MQNSDSFKDGSRPPNILFVMVDELRFPTVFPQGIEDAAGFFAAFMPNVSRLWKRGVKFTSHMTNANACTPARGTLLTGLYSQQTWLCETLTSNSGAPQSVLSRSSTPVPDLGRPPQARGLPHGVVRQVACVLSTAWEQRPRGVWLRPARLP